MKQLADLEQPIPEDLTKSYEEAKRRLQQAP